MQIRDCRAMAAQQGNQVVECRKGPDEGPKRAIVMRVDRRGQCYWKSQSSHIQRHDFYHLNAEL